MLFRYPQRQKSHGLRSGDLAGLSRPWMGFLLSTLYWNCLSRDLMLRCVT